jgi:hypothetical protein
MVALAQLENRVSRREGTRRVQRTLIGWREWAGLPDLGVAAVKAKVDTGARTSTLHAYFTETFKRGGRDYVRFGVHPLQKRGDVGLSCTAPLLDRRVVRDSGGHRQRRFVIATPLRLGDTEWQAELTLTARDTMLFRMLLGRTAMRGRFLVDPQRSYLAGSKPDLASLYPELDA